MKRRAFYQLSLAVPYVVLIITGVVTLLADGLSLFIQPEPAMNVLLGAATFFTLSAVIWGPLYTWMIIVMLIWGRGRSTEDVRRLYMLSPVLLACSMGIPVLIMDPASSGKFLLEGTLRMYHMEFAVPVLVRNASADTAITIGVAWLFMAAICLVVGYAFVGIVVGIERRLEKWGKFKDEQESTTTTPL